MSIVPRADRIGPAKITVNQENAPMLAVNRAVGYRLVRERLLVEHALTTG
ncbi:hypothetical protein AB0I81_01670 [Nonomuraea sp. NPDC050404]